MALSNEPTPGDLVEVARVATAHGVRGGLKVHAHSPDAAALCAASAWWLDAAEGGAGKTRWTVRSSRLTRPGEVLASLQGVDDRDQALALRGRGVWVPRAEFPELSADEAYWIDLQGCDVYGLDGLGRAALIGQVHEVFDNGAHAVLSVQCGQRDAQGAWTPQLDRRGRARHTLVPFVDAHILSLDLTVRRIVTDWPLAF